MVEISLAVVGKPSVGKSTFFNAVNDNKTAKVGNFPFTTIEPNTGISYFRVDCPCKKYLPTEATQSAQTSQTPIKCTTSATSAYSSSTHTNVHKNVECRPRYGKCEEGVRFLPIKLLDIAGLVPGASKGAGLGNKFLDDLRHAQVLIHILDVSGTTNAKGEITEGYDPINDATWLEEEIHDWVFQNLWADDGNRWNTIVKRHEAKKQSLAETLQGQFSGYGCNEKHINGIIHSLPTSLKDGNGNIHINTASFHSSSSISSSSSRSQLSQWTEDDVHTLVTIFMKVRFPTILLLNKADINSPYTDTNIANILEKYQSSVSSPLRCFVASTAAECFLKAARNKSLINYKTGDTIFQTIDDIQEEIDFRRLRGEEISTEREQEIIQSSHCTVIQDEKLARRLNRIKNMILYRYGGTGVWAAIQAAVEVVNPVVVFPVSSFGKLLSLSSSISSSSSSSSSMKMDEEQGNDRGDVDLDQEEEGKKENEKEQEDDDDDDDDEKEKYCVNKVQEGLAGVQLLAESNNKNHYYNRRSDNLFQDALILRHGATVKDSVRTFAGGAEDLIYAELLVNNNNNNDNNNNNNNSNSNSNSDSNRNGNSNSNNNWVKKQVGQDHVLWGYDNVIKYTFSTKRKAIGGSSSSSSILSSLTSSSTSSLKR